MQISIRSNIGKRRSSNQDYADYFESLAGQIIFVLCDGVGGNLAGDVASKKTTEFVGRRFKQVDHYLSKEAMQEWMDKVIYDVNEFIVEESSKSTDYVGMGTTLVLATIVEDFILVAHVGDSRAYTYNQGLLVQLTEDHSLVNELVKSGEITVEESINHPRRNVVTQSIGSDYKVEAEFTQIDKKQVELLLLCSDGLSNMLSSQMMVEMIEAEKDLNQLAINLIAAANKAGGLDNITIILVNNLFDHAKGGSTE